MYTVTVNDRTYTVKNARMFVCKLCLSRNAQIAWDTQGNCVISDNPLIDRPLTKLSSDIRTTIKDGLA